MSSFPLGETSAQGEGKDPAPKQFCRWISPVQLLFRQLVNTLSSQEWAVNYTVLPVKINVTFRDATYPEVPNKVPEWLWIRRDVEESEREMEAECLNGS